jgi:pantoate--beta-alanine ligase
MMKLIETAAEMQSIARAANRSGKTVAVVPTMGYLHEGHVSLMREGRTRADILIATIFVNPMQFGPSEDLSTYPRSLERDTVMARGAGVDYLFTPQPKEIYPEGFQTHVEVERISLPLCGGSRPGHFRGVTTVVCKLFNITLADVALFGKKDYQQLAVIRRMTADLNLPVEIVGMPIVRETDGLAMSSRNSYLSPEERRAALCLSRAIAEARRLFAGGEREIARIKDVVEEIIAAEPLAIPDYIELRDGGTLDEVAGASENTLLALAVRIGKTRLIDNGVLGERD